MKTIEPCVVTSLLPVRFFVIEDKGWDKVLVKFSKTGTVIKVQRNQLKNNIDDPMEVSVFGVGYRGIGKYSFGNARDAAIRWRCMLNRCYGYSNKHQRTYRGCTVCDEWLNFQRYAEWYYSNKILDWVVDKDILVKGNRVYSPDTCCFVPLELNSMFTKSNSIRGNCPIGVSKCFTGFKATIFVKGKQKYLGVYESAEQAFFAYKKCKEENIKRIAKQYKGYFSERLYRVLMEYEVLITD